MQVKILLLLTLCTQLLSAQNFTEVPQPLPFFKLEGSSAAFADIDNDNDLDLLINGLNSVSTNLTKLYRNDGLGHFTPFNGNPFRPSYRGAIAFADVDNDNDQDVLISGFSISTSAYADLYINDGLGNYAVSNTNSIIGLGFGSIAFGDVDNDNDVDLLMNGQQTSGVQTTKLYLNDGFGQFTEALNAPFIGITWGTCALADIDNDNDLDAIVSGADNTYTPTTLLYLNDGKGLFTETTSSNIAKVHSCALAFRDIDHDNDQDLLITGRNIVGYPIARLYKNDGQGLFNQVSGTPFVGVNNGSIDFADVDNDNDEDLMIVGFPEPGTQLAKMYLNDGQGQFTLAPNTPFEGVDDGDLKFADIDNDSDYDVFIIGRAPGFAPQSKLYVNNAVTSSINFVLQEESLDFSIYPNPSNSDQIQIQFKSHTDNQIKINLFGIDGRLYISHQAWMLGGEHLVPVDISPLKKGVYWLQLSDGQKSGIVKLVIP